MVSTKIRLIIFFAAKGRSSIQSSKTRLGADYDSDHELLIAKFRLKLRKGTPHPRPGVVSGRTYPTPEDRGPGQEEQYHLQGAVAVRVQEGLEELFYIQGQEERQ